MGYKKENIKIREHDFEEANQFFELIPIMSLSEMIKSKIDSLNRLLDFNTKNDLCYNEAMKYYLVSCYSLFGVFFRICTFMLLKYNSEFEEILCENLKIKIEPSCHQKQVDEKFKCIAYRINFLGDKGGFVYIHNLFDCMLILFRKKIVLDNSKNLSKNVNSYENMFYKNKITQLIANVLHKSLGTTYEPQKFYNNEKINEIISEIDSIKLDLNRLSECFNNYKKLRNYFAHELVLMDLDYEKILKYKNFSEKLFSLIIKTQNFVNKYFYGILDENINEFPQYSVD